jgi:hypothetical protein
VITRRSLFGLTFGGAVVAPLVDRVAAENLDPLPRPEPAPSAPPMRITIGRTGMACKVEIAGQDVTRLCSEMAIHVAAGDITTLQLAMFVPEGSEIVAEAGVMDLELRDVHKRLRFEADHVRIKADV